MLGHTDTKIVTLAVTNSIDTWVWCITKDDAEESWRLKSPDSFPYVFWNLKKQPLFHIKVSYFCRKTKVNAWERWFLISCFSCREVASKAANIFVDILLLLCPPPFPFFGPLPFLSSLWLPRVIIVEQMLKREILKIKSMTILVKNLFTCYFGLISDIYAIAFWIHKDV